MKVAVGAAVIFVSLAVLLSVIVYKPEGKFHLVPLVTAVAFTLGRLLV